MKYISKQTKRKQKCKIFQSATWIMSAAPNTNVKFLSFGLSASQSMFGSRKEYK